ATRKGGGVYNDSGSPEIANCTFTGNAASWRGGGMCNWSGSARVINCTFTDNAVDLYGGGMYNESGSPRAVNCTFVGNTAGYLGGGMYNFSGSPQIVSCTFTGNGAQKGGGMYNRQNPLKVINCIFWGNNATVDGNEIHVAGGSVTVSYSAVKGGYLGTENTDVDPNLGVLGNYGGPTEICPISPVSSAINKGSWDVTLWESISRDQRGIPREQVSPDMGAYEYRSDLSLLRVRTRGSGTVTRSAAGTPLGTVSDEWYYDEDTVVKLTAVPGDNWIFTGWNGDVTGTENPESVTLGGNTFTAVTALFARQYTITATAGTGGTIEPSGEVGVLAGEDQTFTITPASGYSVEKVLVDGLSVGKLTTYTFTGVTGDHGIEAVFSFEPTPKPEPEPSVTPSPEPSPSPYPTPDPDIPLPEITLTVTLVGGGEILSGPLEIPLTPELLQALLLENWMSPEEFENLLSEGYNSDLFSLFSLGARLAEGDAELTLLVEITVGDLPGGYAYKIYLLASTWDDKGNPAGFSSLVHAPENGMLRKRDTTETWRITISDNGSMDGNPAKRYVDAEIGGVVVAYPLEEPPVSGSGGGCSQGRFSGLAFLFLPLMFFLRKR
ncbi:MAG TPA: choice-of-anchor Q domain-containing protein, partial [Synergistaceae bacterium]|nr:choice-of-anchor Q domain-containing protein [Synergistaceae bacterium]